MFQDFNLIPALTAAENVSVPRELDGIPGRVARLEAFTALAEVGLEGLGDRFPDQLSGGQQQRVAIARRWSDRGASCWPTNPPEPSTRLPART